MRFLASAQCLTMRASCVTVAVPIALFCCSSAGEASTAYEDALAGKKCKIREFDQVISCEYKVGKDLEFWIYGIGGLPSITFVKSNYQGDYYAVLNMGDGCITIRHGQSTDQEMSPLEELDAVQSALTDRAFVSPKSGKVYKDWKSCQAGF